MMEGQDTKTSQKSSNAKPGDGNSSRGASSSSARDTAMSDPVALMVALKFAHTFSKSVVPLSLSERHLNAEVYISSFDNAFLWSVLFIVVWNWAVPAAPGRALSLLSAAVCGVCSILLSLSFDYDYDILFFLHLSNLISLCLLTKTATAWSLRTRKPQGRVKLIGTFCIQLLQVMILLVPALSHPVGVFLMAAVFTIVLAIVIFKFPSSERSSPSGASPSNKTAQEVSLNDVHNVSETNLSVQQTDDLTDRDLSFVGWSTAFAYGAACLVGLNGEQIMDATLTVKLREHHFAGNKGPILAKHCITVVSCMLALWSSRSNKEQKPNPTKLICIWAVAQFVRLAVLGAHANLDALPSVLGMMLLDKYTGALGEIALEYSLILMLTHHGTRKRRGETPRRRFGEERGKSLTRSMIDLGRTAKMHLLSVPTIWLMTMYQLIENFTGGVVKTLVRTSRKAGDDQPWLQTYYQNQGVVVLAMVVSVVAFVVFCDMHYGEKRKVARDERKKAR